MKTEFDNMRAGLAWVRSHSGGVELEIRLVRALDSDAYESWPEYLSSVKIALAHATEGGTADPVAKGWLLSDLGSGLTLESNYASAQSPLAEALRLFRDTGEV